MSLDAVVRALDDDNAVATLDALLNAWRKHRAPELEEAIVRLGNRLAPLVPPVTEEDYAERCRLDRAADAPALLELLAHPPAKAMRSRMRAMVTRTPDPRTGRVFLDMIDDPPTTSSSNFPLWTKLFEALPEVVDARAIPRLDARAAKMDGTSKFWPRFIKQIMKVKVKLPEPGSVDVGHLFDRIDAVRLPQHLAIETEPVLEPVHSLEEAARLFDTDLGAALDQLVGFWDEHRTPDLAALIERLGALVDDRQSALDTNDDDALQALWMEQGRGPLPQQAGRLLDALNEGSAAFIEDRLDLLSTWAPDPRVASVLWLSRTGRMTGARDRFWEQFYKALAHHADPRITTEVDALHTQLSSPQVWQRSKVIRRTLRENLDAFEAGAARAAPWSEADKERLQDLAARAETLTAAEADDLEQEHQLYGAVAKHWEDDAPRLVLADWLQSRGDPRGEFMMLDIALANGKRVKGKRNKYLNAHHKEILGRLAPVLSDFRLAWDRGVLSQVSLLIPRVILDGPEEALRSISTDPRWRTVESLFPGPGASHVLRHAPLDRLRVLQQTNLSHLVGVSERDEPLPVERLHLNPFEDDWSVLDDLAPVFPKLRLLQFTWWGPNAMRQAPPASVFATDLAKQADEIGSPGAGSFTNLEAWLGPMRENGLRATFRFRGPITVVGTPRDDGRYDLIVSLKNPDSLHSRRELREALPQLRTPSVATATAADDMPQEVVEILDG